MQKHVLALSTLALPSLTLSGLVLLGLTMSPRAASAVEFSVADGELTGSLDATLSVGAALRVSDRDMDLVGRENGGTANSVNGDNGNLNYDSGDFVSGAGRIAYEAEARWKNLSGFTRALYLYDNVIMNGDTKRTPLSSRAEEELGNDFTLLDAYLALDVPIGSSYLTLRGGNLLLSWGESTFIQNGINSINPVNVSKIRAAGAEVKDALVPVPMASASLGLNERFSVEGFYQFVWDHTEIEPEGTFFSTNDFASPGGEWVMLGFGAPGISDNPPNDALSLPIGSAVRREEDHDAKDDGQFGAAIRWFEPNLGDTEFGFYFTRLHSRLPLISARTGTEQSFLGEGHYSKSTRYFREFPEDIDTFGFSVNAAVPGTGTALQGELSMRKDQPLQVDDVELLFAALTPLNIPSPAGPYAGQLIFENNQLGDFGFEEYISGYRKKDVLQAQMTLTQAIGPHVGADQFILLGEVGGTFVQDMEDPDVLRYEAPGTYTSGNQFFTDVVTSQNSDGSFNHPQPETENADAFADDTSWGYRLVLRGDYNGAIGSINLQPQIAWSHDVSGTTPSPIVNFIEGRKTITTSLTASYLFAWNFQVSYTNSFGGDIYNLLSDRDFVAFTLGYSY
ncbi:MAG: DUF1302 domain-containing protein [Candidatus Eisenbacteria bacterium]|nr:DUF1302 domain-containing protein [Candidatus Eisenbacteria bacterium]